MIIFSQVVEAQNHCVLRVVIWFYVKWVQPGVDKPEWMSSKGLQRLTKCTYINNTDRIDANLVRVDQVSINTVNNIDASCITSAYLCPVYFRLMILFWYHTLDHWLVLVYVVLSVQRVPLHSPRDPQGLPVALMVVLLLNLQSLCEVHWAVSVLL